MCVLKLDLILKRECVRCRSSRGQGGLGGRAAGMSQREEWMFVVSSLDMGVPVLLHVFKPTPLQLCHDGRKRLFDTVKHNPFGGHPQPNIGSIIPIGNNVLMKPYSEHA